MKPSLSCEAPVWARGGHLQTVLGYLLPSPHLKSLGERIELPTESEDRLVGFHHPPEKAPTLVYLFHGLGGCTDSDYIHRTAKIALGLGMGYLAANHRGCGPGSRLARQPYHSGRAEDLSRFIAWGRDRYPGHRHVAIGFSLSGNALLLLLSGARGTTLPDAAIAVNAPIHLERAALKLREGWNRIYDRKFVSLCRQAMVNRGHHVPLPRRLSLYDFDELYTARASGFRDRADYYSSCSTKPRLKEIRTPTVILTAKDDPFVGYEDYLEAALSPSVHLHIEQTGGHMGYLSRVPTPLGTRRWLDYALHHYLSWAASRP